MPEGSFGETHVMPPTRRVVVAKWADRADKRPDPVSLSFAGTRIYDGAIFGC